MKKLIMSVLIAGSLSVLPVASFAQVTVGLGEQTLEIGGADEQEFVISFSGGAGEVSLWGFVVEYDPATAAYEPIASEDGTVNCTVEDDLGNISPLVFFFPDRDPGQFRISYGDGSFPIAPFSRDGVVGRCPVRVLATEPGQFTLPCIEGSTSASDASGSPLEVTCEDGTLNVVQRPTATFTPEASPTPTQTNTPEASNTPTNTPTNSPRPTSSGGDDDDGCQVVAPANSSAGWLLLIPAAALIWRRRRSR